MEHVVPPDSAALVRHWPVVSLLMAQAAVGHFNRVSISVAGSERWISEYSLSETELGTVYSTFLLAYTLCMLPGGGLIDRWGAPRALTVMGLGSAVFVAATGALGLIPTAFGLGALIVVRSGAGAFSAPLHPGAARTVSLCIPHSRRTFVNGLITGSAILGVASTFSVFGTLIDLFGWPKAFLISAIVTSGLALVWTAVSSRFIAAQYLTALPARSATAPGELALLLRDRRLLALTFSYAAIGYFEYLFFYWLQYYFVKTHQMPSVDARWFATIPALAMAAGMPVGGWLSDRLTAAGHRRAWVPASGMVLSAGLVAAGICCSQPVLVMVYFALAMGAAGACEGPFWTTATDLGGSRGGMSAAILNTGGNAGGMLAPIVTPLIGGCFGWHGGFGIAGVFCLLGALLWRWIDTGAES